MSRQATEHRQDLRSDDNDFLSSEFEGDVNTGAPLGGAAGTNFTQDDDYIAVLPYSNFDAAHELEEHVNFLEHESGFRTTQESSYGFDPIFSSDPAFVGSDMQSLVSADSSLYNFDSTPWSPLKSRHYGTDLPGSFPDSPYTLSASDVSLQEFDTVTIFGPEFGGSWDASIYSQPASPVIQSDQITVTRKPESGRACRKCGKKFHRTSDLRRHERSHAGPDRLCRIAGCERAFTRADKLREHYRQAHGVEHPEEDLNSDAKPSFPCSMCSESFSRPRELNKHYNGKHNHRYKCDLCDKAFGLLSDLHRHRDTTHRMRASLLSCRMEGCTFECPRKDNLLRHVKLKHGGEALEVAKAWSGRIINT